MSLENSPPGADENLELSGRHSSPEGVQPDGDFDAMEIDEAMPRRCSQMLPIVGIGGSAGSIVPLQTFFAAMPPDSGMAFVVILHLSPDHESSLTHLLQQATTMAVVTAVDGIQVEPNHVYVIPPGKLLSSIDGHLGLSELKHERGRRVTVDLFFRTLAESHGSRATAIVLSGADGDGAIGIKGIKEHGGLTVVQDPDEAEQPSMPRAAIETGMVDWILQTAEMPARLVAFQQRGRDLVLPPEKGLQPALPVPPTSTSAEAALREALAYLHSQTGRDFSYYKRATILRRIARRMQINAIDDLPAYLGFLRKESGEATALLRELLISVTNFFRDRDSFAALIARLPQVFSGKGRNDTVRVWVVACATGEEAYTIAMILDEHARTLSHPPSIHVFATDLADDAVQTARDGLYPETIVADVSEERLRRYFIKGHQGYRVRREIRETVLFASHDLLKDSPFSRLDLISCRNLLIYLNREAQARAFDIFNFALRTDGLLFLGSSESAEAGGDGFEVLDKKNRIFAARAVARLGYPVPKGTGTLARTMNALDRAREKAALAAPAPAGLSPLLAPPRNPDAPLSLSWSELHLQLVERGAPPSVLINKEQDIVHLSPSVGRFLQFSAGEPTRNLLRVVHPAMRIELRAALFRAAQSGAAAQAFRSEMELDGQRRSVEVRVTPAADIAPDFFLVVFETNEVIVRTEGAAELRLEPEPLARQLEREITGLKSNLRDVVEQAEASSEELKSSNEELQAMNEEMRSATEELESGREELQSINEELTTVNQELKHRVDELGRTNSDLHNLISATAIATVFLDRELRITRYTPTAITLFNLIPTDIGRPLSDLARQRDSSLIQEDAARALAHLTPTERELEINARWYLARTLPYRTTDDRIAGVVLTYFDITERKQAEQVLRTVGEELEARVKRRTSELALANESLRGEVAERKRAQLERQALVGQLMTAQEAERARISRGLHDEVGQNLASLLLDLSKLASTLSQPAATEKLEQMIATVQKLSRQTHELAVELRPTALDDLGLPLALANYLDEWSTRTKIRGQFSSSGLESIRLPSFIETTVYRIVCEALANVAKHAKATSVSVVLQRRPEETVAIIEDNGIGFDVAAPSGKNKLGILGMKERAALVGGECSIESHGSGNTTIYVRLPHGTEADVAPGEGQKQG